ncbi:MAG: hypothetical protein ACRBHB_25645 [Arenicella sp.]
MIAQSVIQFESHKFPILAGEDEEIVNENMYGKALCQYLESHLPDNGVEVPFYCAEDWGWWLEVIDEGFNMGLCIYSDPDATGNPEKYAIMPSIHNGKKWSWSKFRKIDVSSDVLKIMTTLDSIFSKDNGINKVTRHDDYPF